MTSTLTQIKKKVRRLTASPDPTQLSDADIEEYIDTMYAYDLPAHLKLWKLRDKYTFFTEVGEDKYSPDTTLYNTFQQPVYIDGVESFYSQSESEFFRLWPKVNFEETPSTGDGSAVYTFTLTEKPVLRRQVTITAIDSTGAQQIAQDNGSGGFTDADGTALTGTIDYTTGVVTGLTFTATIDAGTSIFAHTVPVNRARPTSLLYFNDAFYVRPVPDKAYRVEIDVYRRPSQLLEDSGDEPEIAQWWQFLAFGAAKKVLEDRGDLEGIQNILGPFEEQKQLVLQRTVKQQTQQRAETIYTQQTQGWPQGGGYHSY